jgi:hypothetical protein
MSGSSSNELSQIQSDDFVFCPQCNERFKRRGLARHVRIAHRNADISYQNLEVENEFFGDQNVPNPIDTLFNLGFGKPMLNSTGLIRDLEWHLRWRNTMKSYGKQYILPNGAVGRHFVDLLTSEINAVVNGENNSEKIFVLCATVLQKDKKVVSGLDIRRLLERRMTMWCNGNYMMNLCKKVFDVTMPLNFKTLKMMKIIK